MFDTLNLTALNVIQAHKAPIACMALNDTGTMLATASDKGTVVRVFSVPDAKKLWQFRRGSSSARIWSMNFNLASSLLAVSSDSSTIHIYKLAGKSGHSSSGRLGGDMDGSSGPPPAISDTGEDTPSETPSTLSPTPQPNGPSGSAASGSGATSSLKRRSYFLGKSLVGGVGGYLPKSVSEMWEPQRDFAYIKLRSNQGRTVVAISP